MLWIVGKDDREGDGGWEFQGVFDDRELAVMACRGDNYFIGPAILNESLPDDREDWPGSYYPTLEDAPAADEVRRPRVGRSE